MHHIFSILVHIHSGTRVPAHHTRTQTHKCYLCLLISLEILYCSSAIRCVHPLAVTLYASVCVVCVCVVRVFASAIAPTHK